MHEIPNLVLPTNYNLVMNHDKFMFICRHLPRPPVWDGQNGLPTARHLCWYPSGARSHSVLP